MLYDATRFSGNGEASCASCHIFGDMDDLAWDLGNPDNAVTTSPIPINLGGLIPLPDRWPTPPASRPLNGSNKPADFHPMKGPFTTQTLRGLRNSGRDALARRPLHRTIRHRSLRFQRCRF